MRRHPASRDEGYAVVTAVLSTLVVLALSIVALGVATHNSEASALDRDRVRAVHAAEAGINDAMTSILGLAGGSAVPCGGVTGALNTPLAAAYQVEITYYSTWPLTPESEIACPAGGLPAGVVVAGAVIDSIGTAGGAIRRMETAARLTPIYGSTFDKAVFSDGNLTAQNKVVVEGDVYTNEDWACTNNVEIDGSFYGQGFLSLRNTCRVLRDAWVPGDITMYNEALIGRNATSSLGSITLHSDDNRIGENATAKVACNGCVLPRVDPARVTIAESPPPPQEPLPELSFDAADWTGYQILTYPGPTACDDARQEIVGSDSETPARVIRITVPCTLVFENNTNVVLHENLAIVTDGSIEFVNRGVWTTPDAWNRDLFLIVPYGTPCDADNGHIVKQNNTDFDHINFLVYTPCRVLFNNNNKSSAGQIYGGEVTLENNFELVFRPMIVPGIDTTTAIAGYQSQVAYIREIAR